MRTASAPAGRALLEACAEAIADVDSPALRVYSCHDSTLVGIMQALGLQSEASWPAYASVLQLQLLQSQETGASAGASPSRYYLRASLNDQTLTWLGQSANAVETDDGVVVSYEAVRDTLATAFPEATGAFEEFWVR